MFKGSSLDRRFETVRNNTERWLADLEFTVQHSSYPDMAWALLGQKEEGLGIGVAQMIGKPDRVIIQMGLRVEPMYKNQLALLSIEERMQFIWDLRFRLLGLEAPFEDVEDPLDIINFAEIVFIESYSRTTLSEVIFRIHKSYIAASWMLQQRFSSGGAEQDTDIKFGGVVH
jgi:hypothetical protein